MLAVELSPTTATGYARLAFDQMLAVADRLGDERVNERPIAPHVNSVASLVIHCCGVAEFWLGHVGRRSASRPRPRRRVHRHGVGRRAARAWSPPACGQIEADLAAIDAGIDSPHADGLAAPRRSRRATTRRSCST